MSSGFERFLSWRVNDCTLMDVYFGRLACAIYLAISTALGPRLWGGQDVYSCRSHEGFSFSAKEQKRENRKTRSTGDVEYMAAMLVRFLPVGRVQECDPIDE